MRGKRRCGNRSGIDSLSIPVILSNTILESIPNRCLRNRCPAWAQKCFHRASGRSLERNGPRIVPTLPHNILPSESLLFLGRKFTFLTHSKGCGTLSERLPVLELTRSIEDQQLICDETSYPVGFPDGSSPSLRILIILIICSLVTRHEFTICREWQN